MSGTLLREIAAPLKKDTDQFLSDVIKGLSSTQKYLQSKYFYNAKGDKLFQKIMGCDEYYLTRCEMEIFTTQTKKLASTFTDQFSAFDVIELGAGDASKSTYLLKELSERQAEFTYYPIDISKNVISYLKSNFSNKLPRLQLHGLNGEYFDMLEQANLLSGKPKVVLFLGSNIGNVSLEQANQFCSSLRSYLSKDDLVLIGFDLKKDPNIILDAYNDKSGYTREFNLNLLQRINDELGADFILENFLHQPAYDPLTGACKSFLVSSKEQEVQVDEQVFSFKKGEGIYMEISQKYSVEQTDELAITTGFKPVKHFYDSKRWFLDAVWQCV